MLFETAFSSESLSIKVYDFFKLFYCFCFNSVHFGFYIFIANHKTNEIVNP